MKGLLLALLVCLAAGQEIVDYSHTASIQRTERDSRKHYDISIPAAALAPQLLDFPAACSYNAQLQTTEIVETDRLPLTSQESFLFLLKNNMTALLQLADRIKLQRARVADDAQSLSTAPEPFPLTELQLQELRQLEGQLTAINETIKEKVRGLSELIHAEISRTKDTGFNALRLEFEKSSYEARLRFLLQLKQSQGKAAKEGENERRIGEYFQELNAGFDFQKQNLQRLGELLEGFAEHSALKLRITNEMRKLEAKNHIIHNKEECRLKNVRPINDQNSQHIEQITRKLRHLKKIENPNREHCEGVGLKLLNQIKKVLKAYNYSHTCAEGIEQLRQEKKAIEEKLTGLEEQLRDMEYDPTYKKIQAYFNQTRTDKEELVSRIQTFDLNLYALNPAILNDEIASVSDKIDAIRQQLLHPPEGSSEPFDHTAVRTRIAEINQLQYKYCSAKEQYLERDRAAEKAVRGYEFRVEQAVARNKEYLRGVSELRALEMEFNELRTQLLAAIE